ncbi:MAG TPA: alpha/beta hydrolase [Chryseosolibacter sp.]
MLTLKYIAIAVIVIYVLAAVLLFVFQTRLIFYPGKLPKDYRFRTVPLRQEVFIKTADGETINGLFFPGEEKKRAILYLHGNAGDLSGWQFVAEDLLPSGLSIFIIDYRGYGKSTGSVSERGLYADAEAAYQYLVEEKNIKPADILVYGRSIGSGVAVELACRKQTAGVVLESAYTSLSQLANEKVPFFFPSFYLRTKFNNMNKISRLKVPVFLVHGTDDTLIPANHSEHLYRSCSGKKSILLIDKGQHNDLQGFEEFRQFVRKSLPSFFFPSQRYRLHDN